VSAFIGLVIEKLNEVEALPEVLRPERSRQANEAPAKRRQPAA